VAQHGGAGAVTFTLAGGESPGDRTHHFYTLHADFWNTWHQTQLQKLELDCLVPALGCGANGNEKPIQKNKDVDAKRPDVGP